MRRREFISFAGAAVGASLFQRAAGAQQRAAIPVIGYLGSGAAAPMAHLVATFRSGLAETGQAEGRDYVIEFRWADNNYERLQAMAKELAGRPVSVIVATGGNITAAAAKAATSTVPIVFSATADPVGGGLVASLNRPGGNLTGMSALTAELDAKRLELMVELLPNARMLAALVNPNRPNLDVQMRGVEAAAKAAGREVVVVFAAREDELEPAFAALVQRGADALVVTADPFLTNMYAPIVALATRHRVPTIYPWREYMSVGGLMSYGANLADVYRQVGVYTGRILKGEKPANLPVISPTKFDMVVNLKTAKALGLTIPAVLLTRATEVIE